MKNVIYIVLLVLILACNSNKDSAKKEISPQESFQELSILNDSLESTDYSSQNLMISLGRKVKLKSLNLYNNNQLDFSKTQLEFLMKCAATGSEAAKQFKDAANYFSMAQKRFPGSDNAPAYLHNKARILDNILNDKSNARLAYQDLISIYPEHQLSKNAILYLENAFGKSDEELLKLINSSSK
jgi:hypothetical protein